MSHSLHPDTRRMFAVLGASLVAAVVGLYMLFWALERSALLSFRATAEGQPLSLPMYVNIIMFAGLILVNFALFFGLVQWSRYLRQHPRTYQLPVWALFSVVVVAGAALITAMANHSAYVQSYDPIPMDISEGFVVFQVCMGTLVLTALVLLGVRWAPGYRPYVRPQG